MDIMTIDQEILLLVQKKKDLEKQIKVLNSGLDNSLKELEAVEKAIIVANETAKKIQENVQVSVVSVVNYALKEVFGARYEMKIVFEEKYNKSMARIVLTDGEREFNPMLENGGGVVDLVSLCLRISFWALRKGLRNVFIADEPLKFLSVNAQDKVGEFLNILAKKLKVQFIIVTHSEHVLEHADRMIKVTKKKGVSSVQFE